MKVGDKVRVVGKYENGYEGIILPDKPTNGDEVTVLIIKRTHFGSEDSTPIKLSYRWSDLEAIEPEPVENDLVAALNRHTEAMLKLVEALLKLVEALDEHSHQMSVFEGSR